MELIRIKHRKLRSGPVPVLVLAGITLLLSARCQRAAAGSDGPPNIIFILADDLGYGDPGCYGQEKIRTPRIDQLAAEGTRFTQAYAGGPVCTPSRCVLMTGLHNGHGPARDNIPHYHTYLRAEDVTVAEILQQAGYRCGGVGKWSLGDPGTPGNPIRQGFESWFGYLNQDHAHYYYTEYLDDITPANPAGRLELTGNTESKAFYSHDLMADRALQFIRDNQHQPFFLYAAFTLPHFSAREEDEDRFAVPSTGPYNGKTWDSQSRKYAAMVHRLDHDVGRLADLVDSLGLTENTLIIFSSDNGGHEILWEGINTNGPLRGYKRDLTEGGIRVPFIVRWPGRVPAGKASDVVIAFQDMLPTLAELAGAAPPDQIDGISVVNALTGQAMQEEHAFLYWDYGHCRDRFDQAVRMGNWKGIRNGLHGKIQLYDLSRDIGEKTDLAHRHPDIVRSIETIMEREFIPHPRYPVGERYHGSPVWKKEAGSMPENRPPNFLILLIDDLGAMDMGPRGHRMIETPHIDRLAEGGMQWINAYASCPVCSPTRAALLTGKSPARIHFTGHITAIEKHRHPEQSAILPPEDLMYIPHEETTLAEALSTKGYTTGSFGKWHVGGPGYWPEDQGFDVNVAGWTHGSPPSHYYPYQRPASSWNASIPTLQGGHEGEYLTDRLTEEAMAFIRENRDQPFLVYLTHYAVHKPLEAPDSLVKKYRKRIKSNRLDPVYAAMVESVDHNTGRILALLDELGLSRNTVVFFASDNGALENVTDNRPYRRGKGHLYEGGIRVPFIIRWPGYIPAGSLCPNRTITEDIFTTIIDIAGIKPTVLAPLDGRSLVRDFGGKELPQQPDLHWYYPHYGIGQDPGAVVISGDYKLIEHYDPAEVELFNLAADISETTDLSGQMPALTQEMLRNLHQWLEGVEAIMHTPNPNHRQR